MTPAHRLLLLRHAKSSWDDPALADHDRPLSGRGRRAAVAVRDHLAERSAAPELVLCSTAVRTVQTLERISTAIAETADVQLEAGLYAAGAGELLARLRRIPPSTGVVLLIGHNPGIEDLAALLAGGGDEGARADMAAKFPTAALAELSFDGPWSELASGRAALERFWTPRHEQ